MIEIDLTKRYWVFYWNNYEAMGGMTDISESYDTIEEVKAGEAYQHSHEYDSVSIQVFDSKELKIVYDYCTNELDNN